MLSSQFLRLLRHAGETYAPRARQLESLCSTVLPRSSNTSGGQLGNNTTYMPIPLQLFPAGYASMRCPLERKLLRRTTDKKTPKINVRKLGMKLILKGHQLLEAQKILPSAPAARDSSALEDCGARIGRKEAQERQDFEVTTIPRRKRRTRRRTQSDDR